MMSATGVVTAGVAEYHLGEQQMPAIAGNSQFPHMATQEERIKGLETQAGNIRERLAKLEGKNEPRTSNPIYTALIGAALVYGGWLGTQVVSQGKQISQILTLLSPEIIERASSQADSVQSAKQVEKTVKRVMKQGVRLNPALVSEAGRKFVDASKHAPRVWGAATALLDYISYLNSGPSPLPQPILPLDSKPSKFIYPVGPGGQMGQAFTVGQATPPDTAELHLIGKPNPNAESTSGPAFLLIKNADLLLDNTYMKNIILQDCRVTYRGGAVSMRNVYFVNCTFDFPVVEPARELANAIFSAPATTFNTEERSAGMYSFAPTAIENGHALRVQ